MTDSTSDTPQQSANASGMDYPGGTQAGGVTYPGGGWTAPADSADVPLLAEQRQPRVALAVLAGVVVAIVAGLIWYQVVARTGMQIGYLAIGVGLLIGAGMRFAAGGVGARSLQVAAAVITLVTMFAAEYFVARWFIGEYFVSQGDSTPLRLFIAPADMFSVATESVRADPLTLLFWLIALGAAVRMTKPAEQD